MSAESAICEPHWYREDRLLVCESIYLININADTHNAIKIAHLSLFSGNITKR